jgi:KDO2-lipid IV(A) lauroyltransferase
MATPEAPSRLRRFAIRWASRLKTAEHWTTAQAAYAILWTLRRLPADRALDFADRVARRVGPLFGRHRVALDNLRHAFPEKTEAQIEAIALDMWGNMSRLAAEYVFLKDIFDFDPDADADAAGRIEVEGGEIFRRLREEGRPHIFFTAHTGNFELLPVAAASFGLPLSALFRAPNNPYLADYVFSRRSSSMGELVNSRAGAAFTLANVLEEGGNIGLLVDQKFNRKQRVDTIFFGRECSTNPLLAKLARQYECDVYPARTIRLPGNRYRLVVEEKLDLPRTASGAVDIQPTMQMVTSIVERWVREHPGQWMWFHKRWKAAPPRRPKAAQIESQ